MRFTWDEGKNAANITKHGLDFEDAERIVNIDIIEDDRVDYGETRYKGMGLLGSRVVVIIYTEIDEDTIRIISLRKANTHERKLYEQNI